MLCRSIPTGSSFSAIFFCLVLTCTAHAQVQPPEGLYAAVPLAERNSPRPPAKAVVEEKISLLRARLEADPNDPVLLNNLAVHYVLANRMDEALRLSLRSVSIKDDLAGTRTNLAGIYNRLGRHDEARSEAAAAAALAPADYRIRSFACQLDLESGRSFEAVECFTRMADEFAQEPDVRQKLAAALLNAGRLEEARSILEKERDKNPHDPVVLNILAIVCYRLQEFDKSVALLKEAVESRPDDAVFRYNLGLAHLARKNRSAALSQYNLIKGSHPKLAAKLYNSLFQGYVLDARRK